MSERISIARLRYELDQGSAFWDDLSEQATLLALVAAAEAAHAHTEADPYCPNPYCQKLADALARFDFEERP